MGVLLAEGIGGYDSLGGMARIGGVEVPGDEMGVSMVLSAIAACVSKKVATLLGLDRVEAVLRAYAGLSDLLAGEEPRIGYLILEVRVPAGMEEDRVREAAARCPALGMVLGLVREIRVSRLS